VLAALDRIRRNPDEGQQACRRRPDALAEELGIFAQRGRRRGERANDRNGDAGGRAGCVDREVGRGLQTPDAFAILAP